MATKKKAAKKATKKVAKPAEPEVSNKVALTVYGTFPNPIWLKGVDKSGKQYKIRVPKKFSTKLLNKTIEATKIDGELEEYYKWEP